jgi:hypothetical protein
MWRPVRRHVFRKVWDRACDDAGVDHVRLGWLRHTGASLTYAASKDMELVTAGRRSGSWSTTRAGISLSSRTNDWAVPVLRCSGGAAKGRRNPAESVKPWRGSCSCSCSDLRLRASPQVASRGRFSLTRRRSEDRSLQHPHSSAHKKTAGQMRLRDADPSSTVPRGCWPRLP